MPLAVTIKWDTINWPNICHTGENCKGVGKKIIVIVDFGLEDLLSVNKNAILAVILQNKIK